MEVDMSFVSTRRNVSVEPEYDDHDHDHDATTKARA